MSTLSGLFVRGGFNYRPVADVIALLPKGLQHAATVAMRCVLRLEARAALDETATDKELARESERMAEELAAKHGVEYEGARGWSPSLVQKGLHAVHVELGKLGLPLIDRQSGIGMAGRRRITIMPLAGKAPAAGPAPAGPPSPAPLPVDRGDRTTTDEPSSSSSSPDPTRPAPLPAPIIDPALITRARALLPKVRAGQVVDAVLVYGAGPVGMALDQAEVHGKKPDNKPVHSWGYVLRTLQRMKREADAEALAPAVPEPSAAPAAGPAEKARARAREAAEAEAAARRLATLRAAWEALPAAERDAIRARVDADNPGLGRWPNLMEPLYLAEMERRL